MLFRTRALVATAALAGTVIAGAALMLQDARRAYARAGERSVENVALGLERDIRQTIETLDLSLRAVVAGAQRPGLSSLDPDIKRVVLFESAIAAKAFGGAIVTNEAGWVIHDSVSAVPRPINVADRDYFQAHRNRPDAGLVISRPLRSRGDGRWSISLARRVSRPDGSFAGVAVGAVRLDQVSGLFKSLSLGDRGNVSLFTTAGELVVRQPYEEHDIGRDVRQAEVFRRFARAPFGTFEATGLVDGVPRLYAYRQVGSLPLVVSVGLASSEIYSAWTRLAVTVSVGVLLLLLLAAALLLGLRRELHRRSHAERAAQRAEEAAQESAAYLHLVTAGAGDLLLSVDWTGTRRFVSPSSERLLGRPAEQLLGRHWLESVHTEDRPRLAGALSGMRVGGPTSAPVRSRVQCADGSWRWLEALGGSLPDGSGAVFVVRDVTERKRVEDDLQRLNEDLEARVVDAMAAREAALVRTAHAERMQVLGQLAGGIAHDFNNVLQAVSGCGALIERRPADAAGVRRFARMVTEATARGASITRRLLAFSRQDELRAEPVDAAALLAGLQEILTCTLQGAVVVHADAASGLPSLLADKGQLETVLLNLATNARDAMPGGGTVTLAAAEERVPSGGAGHPAELAAGHYVRLRVSDTGTGMSAATLARVTEPFFTTKPVGQGTGLGLSMAKGFVEQSGGRLLIDSLPGQGTTVTLWLPQAGAATMSDAETVATFDRAPRVNRPRVLIVDDDAVVLEVLAEHLEEHYDVLTAPNGTEALALLTAGEAVDALLTDLSMPGMDGLALIREAQRRRPDLPAVLLTGNAEGNAGLALSGAASGAFSLLRKPATVRQLTGRIDALLGAHAQDDASVRVG